MSDAHGVSYPATFLENLSQPVPPVYLLPTKVFEQLHLSHTLSHPQDHVLFPFLHGLEGDNEAQNTFFASAPNAHETHMYTHTQHPRAKVPKYRGLVWVVCEEDLQAEADMVSLRILRRKNVQPTASTTSSPSSSSMYSSGSESFEDEDEDYDIEDDYAQHEHPSSHISVATPVEGGIQHSPDDPMPMSIINEQIKDKTLPQDPNTQSHMHPVNHRSAPTPIPMPSSVSSTNTSASSASFSFDTSASFSTSPESDLTSVSSCSPIPEVTSDAHMPGPDSSKTQIPPIAVPAPAYKVTDPAAPPLLTGTFRPKELLRRVRPPHNGDWDWEFAPAQVPDGISLRNFGVQVPIYATLSDIVVYSPKGPSPAAITLARRFARAIEKKRYERLRALGLHTCSGEKDAHPLLEYNVFVVDAREEEMRRDLPHLMMRICGEPVTGGLFGTRTINHGAHTDGPDGHVVELDQMEAREHEANSDVVGDMHMEVDDPLQGAGKQQREMISQLAPNTVDFALREKEEMRDLTKASEIISLFPTTPISSPLGSPGWSSPEEGSPQQRHRSHSSASSHHPYRSTRPSHLQFLPQIQPPTLSQQNYTFSPPNNTIDISSTSSHFDPQVGQVFLGNSGDVPLALETQRPNSSEDDPFDYETTNDPKQGFGYDICIECHDLATFPSAAHLRAAEEHLGMLDLLWAERYERQLQESQDSGEESDDGDIPPRPPPHANAVIHLTLPSSPSNTQATTSSLMPVIRFLEKWLRPIAPPSPILRPPPRVPTPPVVNQASNGHSYARRWSSVASFMPSFGPFGSSSSSTLPKPASNNVFAPRNRSFTSPSPAPIPSVLKPKPRSRPTRPLKILIYSSDGYTESSVPALCLLMSIKGLTLPEAYLELQVAKRRSFFVYSNDLGILRRMEMRFREERERSGLPLPGAASGLSSRGWGGTGSLRSVASVGTRPAARSVSFASPPNLSGFVRSSQIPGSYPTHQQSQQQQQNAMLEEDIGMELGTESPVPATMTSSLGSLPVRGSSSDYASQQGESMVVKGRPRANTSPWLPSLFGGDHQTWFNDPRFDGSFPSRVLPFLYLGNLNHASNAYMLHALGITHVVSVGECALVPPGNTLGSTSAGNHAASCNRPVPSAQTVASKGPGMHGSLWIEEREGRIKVLDIKGVCDDGIDTLEPQLEPICEWIDKARQEGGQVLVHCRVGVSRSATVTIAYVMKHLNLPLVDAYLIVRSRRLSVLIQPNMRLLYNLCGWEIELAKKRAGGDEAELKRELSRALSWPYLAKEVHALNEKYLH